VTGNTGWRPMFDWCSSETSPLEVLALDGWRCRGGCHDPDERMSCVASREVRFGCRPISSYIARATP